MTTVMIVDSGILYNFALLLAWRENFISTEYNLFFIFSFYTRSQFQYRFQYKIFEYREYQQNQPYPVQQMDLRLRGLK